MRTNRKGFTLIELLAVIVVLAIIALISTPLVLSAITRAQNGANARSVEGYMKAYESAYFQYMLENDGKEPSDPNNSAFKSTVEYSGDTVTCEGIQRRNNSFYAENCVVNSQNFCYKNGSVISKASSSAACPE